MRTEKSEHLVTITPLEVKDSRVKQSEKVSGGLIKCLSVG